MLLLLLLQLLDGWGSRAQLSSQTVLLTSKRTLCHSYQVKMFADDWSFVLAAAYKELDGKSCTASIVPQYATNLALHQELPVASYPPPQAVLEWQL